MVKCATTIGDRNPVVVPAKLIMEKMVAAKFGAKSCAFCKLVMVAAPLKPNDKVMRMTQVVALSPTYPSANSSSPGIIWAVIEPYKIRLVN